MGWVEWGGELIWAVGFTAGGAPFGLSASEFDVAGLEGMGAEDVPLSNSGSWIDDSNDRLRDGDGE